MQIFFSGQQKGIYPCEREQCEKWFKCLVRSRYNGEDTFTQMMHMEQNTENEYVKKRSWSFDTTKIDASRWKKSLFLFSLSVNNHLQRESFTIWIHHQPRGLVLKHLMDPNRLHCWNWSKYRKSGRWWKYSSTLKPNQSWITIFFQRYLDD